MGRTCWLALAAFLLGVSVSVGADHAQSAKSPQFASMLRGCWDRIEWSDEQIAKVGGVSEQTICFDGKGRLSASYLGGGGTYPPLKAGEPPLMAEVEGGGDAGTYSMDGERISVTLNSDYTWIGDRARSVCRIVPRGEDELQLVDCRGEGEGDGATIQPTSTYRRNNWDVGAEFSGQ